MRVLEVHWSRALSLLCEVALSLFLYAYMIVIFIYLFIYSKCMVIA
jgi:hypothetical protein